MKKSRFLPSKWVWAFGISIYFLKELKAKNNVCKSSKHSLHANGNYINIQKVIRVTEQLHSILGTLERANAENITNVIEETLKDFGGVSKEDLYK